MKVLTVLPAYNEEDALPHLVAEIADVYNIYNLKGSILIVNDGSTDRTLQTAYHLQGLYPVQIIDVQPNQGLANAMRTGLSHAVEKVGPTDVIVTMDADWSHRPGLMYSMIMKIKEGHDIVIASRFQKGARIRGLNGFRKFLTLGTRVLFKVTAYIPNVRDYTCGYRAYNPAFLKRVMDHYGERFIEQEGFACMAEILVKSRKLQPLCTEVPMILRYDKKPGESKMRVGRTVRQTLEMILLNLNPAK